MKTLLPLVFGCLAAVAAAQEPAASKPGSTPTLPIAGHGKTIDAKDPLVVEVIRAPGTVDTRSSEDPAAWWITVGHYTFPADDDGIARFSVRFDAMAQPTGSAESREAGAAVLIRADAQAPVAAVTPVIDAARACNFRRTFVAVKARSDGAEQALATRTTFDHEPASRARTSSWSVIRLQWFAEPGKPAPGRIIVSANNLASPIETIFGDDRDLATAVGQEATVLLDADPRVPWQRVIDVVDALHGTGREVIHLVQGARRPDAGAIGLGGERRAAAGRTAMSLGAMRIERRNALRGSIEATEQAVMAGLEWLRRHQAPDGSWKTNTFPAACDSRRGSPCTGGGDATFDPGVTGLALLAFLGAGYDSHRDSPYRDTVAKGLKHLKFIQNAQGCFGSAADTRHTYGHACATFAMCEAYESSKQLPWRKSAEHGISYISACQNPYKGWRYGKEPGDNDASVTSWMLAALAAAKRAGIPVDDRRVQDGLAFLDHLTDEDTGRTGYIKRGERSVRIEGLSEKWPPSETECLRAAAMSSRMFCGNHESLNNYAGARLLAKKLPIWDEGKGSIDMSYWYWGSLAMFQRGGSDWERWRKNFQLAAIENQIRAGCAEGSWDPKDPWGAEGGRVYATAMMALCLETRYRYPRR